MSSDLHQAIAALLTTLAFLAATALDANAYRRFGDGCDNCHAFRSTPYLSPKGETWPDSAHDVHRRGTFMGTECDACHNAGNFGNPSLAMSDLSTAGDAPGFGCLGCHGVPDDAGVPQGFGLRLHHESAGVDCYSCHDTDGVPAPENRWPVGYRQALTLADNPCLDPAEMGTEDWSGNGIGLDNDGDTVYDMDDPDCATVPTCIDLDGDGYGDPAHEDCPAGLVADCNDGDAGAWLPAEEVALLLWNARDLLEWDDQAAFVGPGVEYDVLTGLLDELPVGAGGNEACLGTMPSPAYTDTSPDAGARHWFLVRAVNTCPDGPSTYGWDFFRAERLSTTCP